MSDIKLLLAKLYVLNFSPSSSSFIDTILNMSLSRKLCFSSSNFCVYYFKKSAFYSRVIAPVILLKSISLLKSNLLESRIWKSMLWLLPTIPTSSKDLSMKLLYSYFTKLFSFDYLPLELLLLLKEPDLFEPLSFLCFLIFLSCFLLLVI